MKATDIERARYLLRQGLTPPEAAGALSDICRDDPMAPARAEAAVDGARREARLEATRTGPPW